jgi:hypothetical protein
VSRASKASTAPASEERPVPALPPDVKLISNAALMDAEENLQSVRRHLAVILFNAEDATSDRPAFATLTVIENLFRESAAALMSLNLLEDAVRDANDPETYLRLRSLREQEGGAS